MKIFEAIDANDAAELSKLAAESKDGANTRSADGRSLLGQAIARANPSMTSHLLSLGADPNGTTDGMPVLHFAVQTFIAQNETGNADALNKSIALLLAAGANVHGVDAHGNTPLHLVAEGSAVLTHFLLRAGADADVNVQNSDGKTPLHLAVTTIAKGTIKMLVQKGADPGIQDKQGRTPRDCVRDPKYVELLAPAAISESDALLDQAFKAISDSGFGDLAKLIPKLKDGANAKRKDRSLLAHACISGNTPMIVALLGQGANPNGTTERDELPVLLFMVRGAPQKNALDVIELLLQHGADPNAKDKRGNNALCVLGGGAAVQYDTYAAYMTRYFIGAGVDVNGKNEKKATALHLVASTKSHGMLKILVDAGADVNAQDNESKTPLDHARNALEEQIAATRGGGTPEDDYIQSKLTQNVETLSQLSTT